MTESEVLESVPTGSFIGGEWRNGSETIEVEEAPHEVVDYPGRPFRVLGQWPEAVVGRERGDGERGAPLTERRQIRVGAVEVREQLGVAAACDVVAPRCRGRGRACGRA